LAQQAVHKLTSLENVLEKHRECCYERSAISIHEVVASQSLLLMMGL